MHNFICILFILFNRSYTNNLNLLKKGFMTHQTQLECDVLNVLKKWSGLEMYTIIYDSDIQGNGWKILNKSVLKKKNLYFISMIDNNVFGGYVSTKIVEIEIDVVDQQSFVFSLFRNGEMKNVKYDIESNMEISAFTLFSNESGQDLYAFGFDVFVSPVGTPNSCFYRDCYEYNGEYHPFVNDKSFFTIERIIVVEMY
ncbi:TLDc domain-containing protein [Entamoeba marina]